MHYRLAVKAGITETSSFIKIREMNETIVAIYAAIGMRSFLTDEKANDIDESIYSNGYSHCFDNSYGGNGNKNTIIVRKKNVKK